MGYLELRRGILVSNGDIHFWRGGAVLPQHCGLHLRSEGSYVWFYSGFDIASQWIEESVVGVMAAL